MGVPVHSAGTNDQAGSLWSMTHISRLVVFGSDRVIDSSWPVQEGEFAKGDDAKERLARRDYERALWAAFADGEANSTLVTEELTSEAIGLVDSGEWRELLRRRFADQKGRHCFFICPFGNPEVDLNYKLVIGPQVERHQFEIERVDEIKHSKTITEIILSRIRRARFIVADLTDAHLTVTTRLATPKFWANR
jgi:hypothetical protein